ncbi:MAG: hypothetical protein ACYC5M_00055 [Anaerolineae bacterium]
MMDCSVRRVVGVALLAGTALIFVSGFAVRSEREFAFVLGGYIAGLVTAWLVDQLSRQPAPRLPSPACPRQAADARCARSRPQE